jgi:hypothetical protein
VKVSEYLRVLQYCLSLYKLTCVYQHFRTLLACTCNTVTTTCPFFVASMKVCLHTIADMAPLHLVANKAVFCLTLGSVCCGTVCNFESW